jgi:DNA-binding GntR family transcriptional regulator
MGRNNHGLDKKSGRQTMAKAGVTPPQTGVFTAANPARNTAADIAMSHIKKEIWLGNFRPGDRLSPVEISKAIGVSPTPAREALAALAQQGRVIIQNHRGAFVSPFDVEHLTDHYDLLGLVYGWAAGRCAEKLTTEAQIHLRGLSAQLSSVESDDDLFSVVRAIEKVIYETAGSYSAHNAARTLEGVVPGNVYSWVPSSGPLARTWVAKIVSAVCSGKSALAVDRAHEFFSAHGRLVIQQLQKAGVIEAAARPNKKRPLAENDDADA